MEILDDIRDISSTKFTGKWMVRGDELFFSIYSKMEECWYHDMKWVRKRKWYVLWLFEVECLEKTGEMLCWRQGLDEKWISEINLVDVKNCYDQQN